MSLKKSYYLDQIEVNKINGTRSELGFREMYTLDFLARQHNFFLKSGHSLLDLGCGDKYIETAALSRGLKYTGTDIDQVHFERDQLPFEDEQFDVVVSYAVIEHLYSPEFFLSEIYRVLKKGGLVLLSTPNWIMDYRNFYNDPTHVKPYTPESLERVMRLSKFSDIRSYPGLRCKPLWYYTGKYKFLKAFYLLPFRGQSKFIPEFLKGHARSIFAIAIKQ